MARREPVIRAAGAVLWRTEGDGVRVALVHRPRYDDWSLPKGKLHDGECAPAAAVREVTEETGFKLVLNQRLDRVHYEVSPGVAKQSGPKIVDYWAACAVAGSFTPNAEVDELRWLRPDEAVAMLSYRWDRTVLNRFAALPPVTATLLLVRHAKAGSRHNWDGEDDLRPLTAAGRRQTAALRACLPLFGPRRVHSAPPVRCVQTVAGLADDLGIDVVNEPLLAEASYWPDRVAAMARLLELTALGATTVVCSQGGVIPDLVKRLAVPAKLAVGNDVPSKKASTWVLSLHDRQLIAADYYPPSPPVS